MFIDRTFELFEIFDKNAKSNDEKTALRTNLRRRTENVENEAIHAVPSLAAATEHESSQPMDSMSFINEATNIWSNILKAEKLLLKTSKQQSSGSDFQEFLGVCLLHVASLDKVSENLLKERNSKKGWLESVIKGFTTSQLDQHEAAIVWFLNHKISSLAREYEKIKILQEEKDKEVQRVKSLKKTVLASSRPPLLGGGSRLEKPIAESISSEKFANDFALTEGQLQLLAVENDALMKEYTETQSQIVTTQTSLNEISRLQGTLQEQLVYQASQVDRLFDEASSTVDTLRKANTYLNQATKKQSASVRFFLWLMFFASLFVLLLHWMSD